MDPQASSVRRIHRLCWEVLVTVTSVVLLVDIFMVLLLLKLDAAPQIPWVIVATPLWVLLSIRGRS
jgi:hypothetical protein